VDDPAGFKDSVAQYYYGNCILVPAGNNQVRCIHSCFVFGGLRKPTEIVGILGSRRSSPFKSVNIDHAVKLLTEPRTTRTSESTGGELWLPTMEEFLGCENEEAFRDLTSAEEDFPAAELWKRAQTFWVHPKIFELLDLNTPQRAGKIAIEIMRALPVNIANQDHLDYDEAVAKAHQLMLFLWAVENLQAKKVSIQDAPTSELFDNRAQEIMGRLKPERSQSRVASVRHLTPQEEERGGKVRGCDRGRRDHRVGKGRRTRRKTVIERNDPPSHDNSSSDSESSSSSRSIPGISSSISPARSSSRSKSGHGLSKSRSISCSEPRNRTRSRERRGHYGEKSEDNNLNAVMMKNLTAITALHLKRDAKEDKKKSMLSGLAPEAAKLFKLLSARDWDDSNPRINPFVQELLSDKDTQQASGIMQTQTKRWAGEISDKGLLASFASG
jgi:hypothetical protein